MTGLFDLVIPARRGAAEILAYSFEIADPIG